MPNNIGAFGENFPYTNCHDLNLDYIVKKTNECVQKVEEYTPLVDSLEEHVNDLQNDVDHINDTITETINTAVEEQVPEAIQDEIESGGFDILLTTMRKRRFVVISDSYGAGWTPDGDVTSFATIIQDKLHINNADFFQAHKGGARFGDISGSQFAFDTVLLGLIPSITDPDSITDIIFAGGYNEGASSVYSISEGIDRCKTLISSTFHNKSLRVHLFSIGYHCSNPAQREALFYRYQFCYAKSGWAYSHLTPAICYQSWWASDGYHPLQPAQDAIARQMMNVLMGGTQIGHFDASEFAPTSLQSLTFYTIMLTDYFDAMLNGQTITLSEYVTIDRSTPVKVLEINSNLPLCNTNDNTRLEKWVFPAILEINNQSFKNATLVFHLKQENRTTYGLYVNTFMLNEAGTNYAIFNNVSAIQMLPNSFHVQIPYKF